MRDKLLAARLARDTKAQAKVTLNTDECIALANAYVNRSGPFAAAVDAAEPVATPIDERPKPEPVDTAPVETVAAIGQNQTTSEPNPTTHQGGARAVLEEVRAAFYSPELEPICKPALFSEPMKTRAQVKAAPKAFVELTDEQAAEIGAGGEPPDFYTTYHAIDDDTRRRRLLHIANIARELPPYRPEVEPKYRPESGRKGAHSPIVLEHRVLALVVCDPVVLGWYRADCERIGEGHLYRPEIFGVDQLAEVLDIPSRLTYFLFHVTDTACWNHDDRYILQERLTLLLDTLEKGALPHAREPNSRNVLLPFKYF